MTGVPSVLKCDFAEDEFQALAFAELAQRFRAIVVGGPYIEDRRAERRHGVDAWIRIRAGGRLRVLFLQYKVPQLVISAALDAKCAALYRKDAYFRFRLHRDGQDVKIGAADVHRQHNNLVALRNGLGHPAYYCSPALLEYKHLLDAFYRGEIYEKCLLGDPLQIGYVRGRETHHVTYASDLRLWGFHSEAKPLGRPTSWERILDAGEPRDWNADDLEQLADDIATTLESDQSAERDEPDDEGGRAGRANDATDEPSGARSVLRLAHAAWDAFRAPVVFLPVDH